jgi:hypothetical protein
MFLETAAGKPSRAKRRRQNHHKSLQLSGWKKACLPLSAKTNGLAATGIFSTRTLPSGRLAAPNRT